MDSKNANGYLKLKALIVEKGHKQQDVATAIGMDRSTFNVKINGSNGRDFTLQEAAKIASFLKININNFF